MAVRQTDFLERTIIACWLANNHDDNTFTLYIISSVSSIAIIVRVDKPPSGKHTTVSTV